MTVARQICILGYGVSLSCKRELKRTQTETGVSEGEGREDSVSSRDTGGNDFDLTITVVETFRCTASSSVCFLLMMMMLSIETSLQPLL